MGERFKGPVPAAFDDDGFLMDPDRWDENLAEQIAAADGIDHLDSAHWAVIRSLRDHFARHHSPPAVGHVCYMVSMQPTCLDSLFHGSREAWRIAGLPNPGEEAKAYM